MGLAPSRQLYLANNGQTPLPFISRPQEDYHYNNGEPPNSAQLTALAAATVKAPASGGGTSGSGEGPSPSSTPRRASVGSTPGAAPASPSSSSPAAEAVAHSARAAAALPIAEDGQYYYYEHRLIPLTKEFFPSPQCELFEQLWNARQSQNPRYHFQLEQTWSPGAMLDPTACYASFEALAANAMMEEAVSLASKAGVEERQAAAAAAGGDGATGAAGEATGAENGPGATAEELRRCAAEMRHMELRDVPFASREELFDLLVRTTEDSIVYESNQALRSAAAHVAEVTTAAEAPPHAPQPSPQAMKDGSAGKANGPRPLAGGGASGSAIHKSERRIRPLPCAVVLVRTPVPPEVHRHIYYVANSQRHHRMGAKAMSKTRRRPMYDGNGAHGEEGGRGGGRFGAEGAREINISNAEVLEAVREQESRRLREQGGGPTGADPTPGPAGAHPTPTAPRGSAADAAFSRDYRYTRLTQEGPRSDWMAIRPKGVPVGDGMGMGPIELRVVGIYGCWTIQEILSRSLFSRLVTSPSLAGADAAAKKAQRDAVEAVLQRATPYGVPSYTLVQVTFFARQVGDKEQSHTFFSLCRYFAHGLRYCLGQGGSTHDPSWGGGGGPVMPLPHQSPSLTWEAFVRALEQPISLDALKGAGVATSAADADRCGGGGGGGAAGGTARTVPSTVTSIPQAHSDLSTVLFIRFSNIPQLQLTRQLRVLAEELRASFPQPMRLEALQAAQRSRTSVSTQANQPPSAAMHAAAPTAGPTSRIAAGGAAGSASSSGSGAGLEVRATPAALKRKLPASLDPEAITAPPTLTPTERLHRDGILCYIDNGLVVVRISHQLTVRALLQMSYSALSETMEAICVTLSTSAPPQMSYRGELRPAILPGPNGNHSSTCSSSSTHGGGAQVQDGAGGGRPPPGPTSPPGGGRGGKSGVGQGSAGEALLYQAVLEDSYYNSARFLLDPAKGFPMIRYRCPFLALDEVSPDGAPPASEQPRETDPARNDGGGEPGAEGAEESEVELVDPLSSRRRIRYKLDRASGLARLNPYDIAVQPRSLFERERGSYLPLQPVVSQLLDVYTVSAELDGKTMQYVFDLATKRQYGVTLPPSLLMAGTPDSVLGWSPAAQLHLAAAGAACAHSSSSGTMGTMGTGNASTSSHPAPLQRLDSGSSGYSAYPLARVQDPHRVLHAGDVIRFSPSASPTSTRTVTPTSVRRPVGGRAGNTRRNPRDLCAGTWYVDDTVRAEDLVLSWMRRVSGRARESKVVDTKWLSYPPVVQDDLFHHSLAMMRRYPACFVDDPALAGSGDLSPEKQAIAELVRSRGFRQWRFSQDGFVYFHGVSTGASNHVPLVELLAESMGKRVRAVNSAKHVEEREQGLAAIKAEAKKTGRFYDTDRGVTVHVYPNPSTQPPPPPPQHPSGFPQAWVQPSYGPPQPAPVQGGLAAPPAHLGLAPGYYSPSFSSGGAQPMPHPPHPQQQHQHHQQQHQQQVAHYAPPPLVYTASPHGMLGPAAMGPHVVVGSTALPATGPYPSPGFPGLPPAGVGSGHGPHGAGGGGAGLPGATTYAGEAGGGPVLIVGAGPGAGGGMGGGYSPSGGLAPVGHTYVPQPQLGPAHTLGRPQGPGPRERPSLPQLQPQQLQEPQPYFLPHSMGHVEGVRTADSFSFPATPGAPPTNQPYPQLRSTPYRTLSPTGDGGDGGGEGVGSAVRVPPHADMYSFFDTASSYGAAHVTDGFFDQSSAGNSVCGPGMSRGASHRPVVGAGMSPTSAQASTTSQLGSMGVHPAQAPHSPYMTTGGGGGGGLGGVTLSGTLPSSGSDGRTGIGSATALSSSSPVPALARRTSSSPSASPVTTTVATLGGEGGGVTVQVRTRTRRDSLQLVRLAAPPSPSLAQALPQAHTHAYAHARAQSSPSQAATSSPYARQGLSSPQPPSSTTSPRLGPVGRVSFHRPGPGGTDVLVADDSTDYTQCGAMGVSPGGGEEGFLQPPRSPREEYGSGVSHGGHGGSGDGPAVGRSLGSPVLSGGAVMATADVVRGSGGGGGGGHSPGSSLYRLAHGGLARTTSGRSGTTHNPYYLPGVSPMDSPGALSVRSHRASLRHTSSSPSFAQAALLPQPPPRQGSGYAFSSLRRTHEVYSGGGDGGCSGDGLGKVDDDGGFLAPAEGAANNAQPDAPCPGASGGYGYNSQALYGTGGGSEDVKPQRNYYYSMDDENPDFRDGMLAPVPAQQQQQQQQVHLSVPPIARWPQLGVGASTPPLNRHPSGGGGRSGSNLSLGGSRHNPYELPQLQAAGSTQPGEDSMERYRRSATTARPSDERGVVRLRYEQRPQQEGGSPTSAHPPPPLQRWERGEVHQDPSMGAHDAQGGAPIAGGSDGDGSNHHSSVGGGDYVPYLNQPPLASVTDGGGGSSHSTMPAPGSPLSPSASSTLRVTYVSSNRNTRPRQGPTGPLPPPPSQQRLVESGKGRPPLSTEEHPRREVVRGGRIQ